MLQECASTIASAVDFGVRNASLGGRVAATMLAGISPGIKIVRTGSNQKAIDKLMRAKWTFLSYLTLLVLLSGLLVLQIWLYRRKMIMEGRGSRNADFA